MWLWAPPHAAVVGHPIEIENEGLHTPRQIRADRDALMIVARGQKEDLGGLAA
jgi:hypothetical protein